MSSNLIFHVVSRRNWQEFNKGGYYTPAGTEHTGGIICTSAHRLKEYINSNFEGRSHLLILVVDKSRLVNQARYDKEKKYFVVENSINMDSILDKIRIAPDKKGYFDIEVYED